jgi:type IV pilus assembly protein PilW
MEILYGVDTNQDFSVDDYRTANAVGNWANVISVRISLLMVSLENNLVVDGPQDYYFNGATITPAANDRRLRRVFTQTIVLRNRTS